MIPLVFLFLLFSFTPLFSGEIVFFSSNKSGMILDEIPLEDRGEFYIERESFSEQNSYSYRYYNSEGLYKEIEEFYRSSNLKIISKIIYKEGIKQTVELYRGGKIYEKLIYMDSILTTRTIYKYNSNNELIEVELRDSEESILHKDKYYRNRDGSLRRLIRDSGDGYYIHWFYKDGAIVENWIVEGDISTRTVYDEEGRKVVVTSYSDSLLSSETRFYYSEDGRVNRSLKTSAEQSIESLFNSEELLIEVNIEESGVLVKKTIYEYDNSNLIREYITGHGSREEYIFEYNDRDEVVKESYYINKNIKSERIIENEDNEVFNYYKDGKIYLKEFFFQGEKTMRELYLNGELFKSETYNE